ncbi:hypothetical protein [Parerythrobacter jejuensis]|uniref:Ferrochelatase n=1 Tax=Parerythrobacter jejuensis TaxID=795812 RepID=A0A845ATE0_9SPHN|nr:hypothetical protein [Parerythrobacter jejuensis]MXP32769.1 hypothetical protein [Parerythrobacter jejuensis]
MKLKKMALGLAAMTMAVAPMGATAIANERAIAPVTAESELEGENGILIALLAAAAVIAGIIIIADDDEATSP